MKETLKSEESVLQPSSKKSLLRRRRRKKRPRRSLLSPSRCNSTRPPSTI